MSVTFSGTGIVILPNPELGDLESQDVSVNSRRTMDGTRYTYVQTTGQKRFELNFDSVDRGKMIEMETFFK